MSPIKAGVHEAAGQTVIAPHDVGCGVFAAMLAVMQAAAHESAATRDREILPCKSG